MRHIREPGYLPVLRAGNIQDFLNLSDDLIWVPKNLISDAQLLSAGDIAICMSSGSRQIVGKTAILDKEWQGAVGAFCGIVRCTEKVNAGFLARWFRTGQYRRWRDKQAAGTNIQNLKFSVLENMAIPLPPLTEQKRIAVMLDGQMAAVERARKAAEEKTAAARALPSALLRSAFSPAESGRLPNGWEIVRITDVCKIIRDRPLQFKGEKRYYDTRAIGVNGAEKTPATVTYSVRPSRADCYPPLNSVGFAKMKGTRKTVLINADLAGAIFSTGFLFLAAKTGRIVPEFLLAFLRSELFQHRKDRVIPESIMGSITLTDAAKLEMPLPPLSEQRQIASRLAEQLAAAEKARQAAEDELREINALPAALLRKVFAV